ncbi:MAG: hypothetical protein E7356_03325 [Clostridiales bacterium]|nr:hypothetical protein [Clostridiales bacterium]
MGKNIFELIDEQVATTKSIDEAIADEKKNYEEVMSVLLGARRESNDLAKTYMRTAVRANIGDIADNLAAIWGCSPDDIQITSHTDFAKTTGVDYTSRDFGLRIDQKDNGLRAIYVEFTQRNKNGEVVNSEELMMRYNGYLGQSKGRILKDCVTYGRTQINENTYVWDMRLVRPRHVDMEFPAGIVYNLSKNNGLKKDSHIAVRDAVIKYANEHEYVSLELELADEE